LACLESWNHDVAKSVPRLALADRQPHRDRRDDLRIEVPQPWHIGTLDGTLALARHSPGIRRATWGNMNQPTNPSKPTTPDPTKEQPAPAPVNPDPKSHPIHPAIPVQPIHEGTDPPAPITETERTR
jgi:hypothetical protein